MIKAFHFLRGLCAGVREGFVLRRQIRLQGRPVRRAPYHLSPEWGRAHRN